MKKKTTTTICCLIILILSACAPHTPAPVPAPTTTAAATIMPTATTAPTITPTPAPIWKSFPLIGSQLQVAFPNATTDYQGKEIFGSEIALDNDTRWVIDMQVDNLVSEVGEASSGIVLRGITQNGDEQLFILVYQYGNWSIGYQPDSTEQDYSYWQTFDRLIDPNQKFELSISQDGKNVSLKNDLGFEFHDTLTDRVFENAKGIVVTAQIGPHTSLSLSRLVIEQLQTTIVANSPLPADYVAPTAITPTNGSPSYIFHVAVDGNDAYPGTVEQPFATIEHARDVIRTISAAMQGPITVILHGGTYALSQPIQFTADDSGQNGYDIIYRAAEGEQPIFSGGVMVTGWQKMPDSPLWKTTLGKVGLFRQMYVNGVRATRASSSQPIAGLRWAKGDTSEQDGIVVDSTSIPVFANPQGLELHWVNEWRDMRLLVRDVEQNYDGITTFWMRQPYYATAGMMGDWDNNPTPRFNAPFFLENMLELLDQPGEWYANPDTGELFYLPQEGEDMTAASVVIPQTQTLLEITGGPTGQEVHNLVFDGLSFEYAGWTRASEVGTFGWQAEALIAPTGDGNYVEEMTPSHVRLNSARDLLFMNCRFEHLGAVGLGLINNVTNVTVQGNLFHDISDAAMVIGTWEHAYITAPWMQVPPHDNLIANNLISQVGVEYWGAPAITAFYVNNIHLLHNEISQVPYTGISLGWGWSFAKDSTTAHDNQVAYNLITDLTLRARDGGGIYTLGQDPGSVIEGNVIRRMQNDYGCLYPDEGSAFIIFRNNVCDTVPQWLHLWTSSIHDIKISNTYTNTSRMENAGTNIRVENTVIVNGQAWTPEAQAIIDNAGLEAGYAYLHDWLNEK